MAKARGVEAKLARLRLRRDEPAGPELVAELRKALADPSNLVAAEAAEQAGTRLLTELAPDLVQAFHRFLVEPLTSDKLCLAKTKVVEALNKIDHEGEEVFLLGIRHVQQEPAWPEAVDTAVELRGNSALGLVRIRHRDTLNLLADLLGDREADARLAAVQALGQSAQAAAVPLLRFKARAGDKEAGVTAECLTALVRLTSVEAFPFVREFLHAGPQAVQEGAILALGESRRPEALPILRELFAQPGRAEQREAILLAVSMLRLPAAMDFLLEVLGGDDEPAALAALSALAIHLNNQPLWERIAAVVATKGEGALRRRFRQKIESREGNSSSSRPIARKPG